MIAEILESLDSEMQTPEMYGWFHNVWLLITISVTAILCKFCRNASPQRVCRILLSVSLLVIVLEIYKQINYTFTVNEGGMIETDYQWYAFPFQFCSTPMYVGVLAGIFRKGKLHKALCAYLATYAVFAGLAVMAYPADVFIKTIGINIQTMICHGSMIVVGVYLMYVGYVKVEHKTLFNALPIFAGALTVAVVLNEIMVASGILKGETFNMFFVSPHFAPSLPVYSIVQQYIAYPWCLILYIAGFTAAAYLILLLAIAVKRIASRKKPATV